MANVIGSEYCSLEEMDLAVVRKVMPNPESTVFVSDKNNNLIFKVMDTTSSYGLHKKRVLSDAAGTPILSFQHKQMSLHYRWRVYRGSSKAKNDLIFTAKQSSMMGSNRELEVFLASNKDEKICDYKVASSSDVFYAGDSNTNVIAETHDDYMVKVHPNIDQAFIISLIVILDGIHQQQTENRKIRIDAAANVISLAFGA